MSAAVVSSALAASASAASAGAAPSRLDTRRPRLAAVARLASREGLRWAVHFARVVLCAVESWRLARIADARDLASGARAPTPREAEHLATVARLGGARPCWRVDGPRAERALAEGRESIDGACDALTLAASGEVSEEAAALVALAWNCDVHSVAEALAALDPADDAAAARLLLSVVAGERRRRREAKARRQRDAAARAAG